MDEYIGMVKLFAGNFAPKGWAYCYGQLMPISQYSAVFSLLGTTYGGDGVTTFALPDLRNRVPVGAGQSYPPGQVGGSDSVTLGVANMPPHAHTPSLMASSSNAAASVPTATSVLAAPGAPSGREFNATYGYNDSTPDITLAPTSVKEQVVGGGQPFKTMPPFLGMSYIICMEGIYPSRP